MEFSTVDRLYTSPIADEGQMRAKNMADMFHYKGNYFRDASRKW
jgi:hemoglobin